MDEKPTATELGALYRSLTADVTGLGSLNALPRQLAEPFRALRPIKFSLSPELMDFGRRITQTIEAINAAFRPTQLDIPSRLAEIIRQQSRVTEALRSAVEPSLSLASQMSPLFTRMRQFDVLNKANWIAHPMLPVDELVGAETDPKQVGQRVDVYVEENHESICEALEMRFSDNEDEDASAFASELVQAYRMGLYRLIVPAVFPEIERCARSTLALGPGKGTKVVLDTLNEKLGELPVSKIGAFYGLASLSLLDDYCYKSFRSEIEAESFKRMIHRHGSQHGLLRYHERRDCLNAIFLFDFILSGCAAIRDLMRDVSSQPPVVAPDHAT